MDDNDNDEAVVVVVVKDEDATADTGAFMQSNDVRRDMSALNTVADHKLSLYAVPGIGEHP